MTQKNGTILSNEKHIDIFSTIEGDVEFIKLKREDFNEIVAVTALEASKAQIGDVTKQVSENVPTFTTIDNEEYRTYHFPDGSEYTVAFPVKLNVKRKPEGDSHRVIDSENTAHYIRAGWNAITWRTKDGGPGYRF